ncbi:MAG: dihydrolipoamide acetyltransferase family protein [Candidatus Nanohaloarchaea archaeon]
MKFEFPDTGEGVTEGKFLDWKVEEGEEIEEDQVVGEAETDKAVVEIPSPADGAVKDLKVEAGDTVKVGEVIMELDTGEETDAGEVNEAEASEKVEEAKEESINGAKENIEQKKVEENEEASSSGEILALPRVRKLAEEKGVDLGKLNVEGRIREEDVLKASGEEEYIREEDEKGRSKDKKEKAGEDVETSDFSGVNARPSVRELARQQNVEISEVEGSGRGGEVTREDVLEASEKEVDEEDEPVITHEGDVERVEMSNVRRITAERMAESKDEAAHVTHIEKADITRLVELRESVKSDVDAHLTYLPFIIKACVAALKQHPRLNSELDLEHDEIIQKNFYDFNIAVDTERGLMVPRIEDVDQLTMVELAEEIAEKASKAREGGLSRQELKSGTFSITNIGVIGGEAFTPIIYPPQTAILGVGKIQETAEVIEGEVVPRKTVKLSLSYDHRVVDGAEAAKFMNKVVKDLENPKNLLVDM